MTKNELIAEVADMYDYPKTQVKEIVNGVFETVAEALEEGESVAIDKFGTFSLTAIAERDGRNPQTGETITIAAHNRLKFKPAKALKDAVR